MSISTDSFIKIAIADDHKIFRDGIKMALFRASFHKDASLHSSIMLCWHTIDF